MAFTSCKNLTEIHLPDALKELGKEVFMDCISLTELDIPDGVTIIQTGSFAGCRSLKKLTLPENLTKIYGPDQVYSEGSYNYDGGHFNMLPTVKDCTFYGCELLTSLRFPASLQKVSGALFSGCDNLTTVYFESTSLEGKGTKTFQDYNERLTVYFAQPVGLYDRLRSQGINCKLESIAPPASNVPSTGTPGLYTSNGKNYIYDSSGKLLKSGWYQAENNWYYLNDSGAAVVNCWRLKDGKYCYLGADGKMETSRWVKDYDNWYYVDSTGARYESKWAKLDNVWYWFGGSGKMMADGWLKLADGYWYYFDESGALLTNTTTPDGYRVDDDGRWIQS